MHSVAADDHVGSTLPVRLYVHHCQSGIVQLQQFSQPISLKSFRFTCMEEIGFFVMSLYKRLLESNNQTVEDVNVK